jgi:hypothetical protein
MKKDLEHWGVLGMHWGIHKAEKSGGSHSDHVTVSQLRRKSLHQLSNEDLRKLNTRVQLEKQYKDLNPNKIKRGVKSVNDVVSTLGKITATVAAITTLASVGNKIYNSLGGAAKSAKVASEIAARLAALG